MKKFLILTTLFLQLSSCNQPQVSHLSELKAEQKLSAGLSSKLKRIEFSNASELYHLAHNNYEKIRPLFQRLSLEDVKAIVDTLIRQSYVISNIDFINDMFKAGISRDYSVSDSGRPEVLNLMSAPIQKLDASVISFYKFKRVPIIGYDLYELYKSRGIYDFLKLKEYDISLFTPITMRLGNTEHTDSFESYQFPLAAYLISEQNLDDLSVLYDNEISFDSEFRKNQYIKEIAKSTLIGYNMPFLAYLIGMESGDYSIYDYLIKKGAPPPSYFASSYPKIYDDYRLLVNDDSVSLSTILSQPYDEINIYMKDGSLIANIDSRTIHSYFKFYRPNLAPFTFLSLEELGAKEIHESRSMTFAEYLQQGGEVISPRITVY